MAEAGTNGATTNGADELPVSTDLTALRFREPLPADEVIEQRIQVPEELRGHVMVVPLEGLFNWAQRNSLWPVTFGLACCAIEYMGVQDPRFDLSRFGMEINRASPRQADIMIISGTVTVKMAYPIRRIYDQMADPKYVISMGVCATAGGPVPGQLQHGAGGRQLPARGRLRGGLPAAAGCAAVRDHPAAGEDQEPRGRRQPGALAGLAGALPPARARRARQLARWRSNARPTWRA